MTQNSFEPKYSRGGWRLVACECYRHFVVPYASAAKLGSCRSRHVRRFCPVGLCCPRDGGKSWPNRGFLFVSGTQMCGWVKVSKVARMATSPCGSCHKWTDEMFPAHACDQFSTNYSPFRSNLGKCCAAEAHSGEKYVLSRKLIHTDTALFHKSIIEKRAQVESGPLLLPHAMAPTRHRTEKQAFGGEEKLFRDTAFLSRTSFVL